MELTGHHGRRFNGKYFGDNSYYFRKSEAKAKAERIRKSGKTARVVSQYQKVYSHTSKRKRVYTERLIYVVYEGPRKKRRKR